MALLPTGVTMVTATAPQGPAGATANAVTSLSLDPPLMLACLDRGSRTLGVVREAGRFGVSVLAAGQEELAHGVRDQGAAHREVSRGAPRRARRRAGPRRLGRLGGLLAARPPRRRRPRDRRSARCSRSAATAATRWSSSAGLPAAGALDADASDGAYARRRRAARAPGGPVGRARTRRQLLAVRCSARSLRHAERNRAGIAGWLRAGPTSYQLTTPTARSRGPGGTLQTALEKCAARARRAQGEDEDDAAPRRS